MGFEEDWIKENQEQELDWLLESERNYKKTGEHLPFPKKEFSHTLDESILKIMEEECLDGYDDYSKEAFLKRKLALRYRIEYLKKQRNQ